MTNIVDLLSGQESILEEALRLTSEDRAQEYGDFGLQAERIAAVWSAITGHPVNVRHVPLMLAGLKIIREAEKPKRDNRVDACGYLQLADQLGPH